MTIARRPEDRRDDLDSQIYTVAAGQTVRAGMGIKVAATDTSPATADYPQAQEAIANTDLVEAIAAGEPGVTYAAGDQFTGYLMSDGGVIPVMVGTGGVTRGTYICATTNGFTDAPANGNGTTRIFSPGTARAASSTAGDFVGMLIKPTALAKT
jgi:hypothetical protein